MIPSPKKGRNPAGQNPCGTPARFMRQVRPSLAVHPLHILVGFGVHQNLFVLLDEQGNPDGEARLSGLSSVLPPGRHSYLLTLRKWSSYILSKVSCWDEM